MNSDSKRNHRFLRKNRTVDRRRPNMKMKKRMSFRFLALLLVLSLALSAPLTAYAEEIVPEEPAVLLEEEYEEPAAENEASVSDEIVAEDISDEDTADPEALYGFTDEDDPAVVSDGNGGFYEIEFEEEPAEDESAYDPALLDDALMQLAYEEDASDLQILEAAYETVLAILPDDAGRPAAAALLSDLLESTPADQALVTGTDETGLAAAWVIARITPDGLYYILDPAEDIGRSFEEWTSFLTGSDGITGWIPDEEFTSDEWTAAHPVSPEAFIEPEETTEEEAAEEDIITDEEAMEDPEETGPAEEITEEPEDPAAEEALQEEAEETPDVNGPEETADTPVEEALKEAEEATSKDVQDDAEESISVRKADAADPAKTAEPAVSSKKTSLKNAWIYMDQSFTYNGAVRKPKPDVWVGWNRLRSGKDYTLHYSHNRNAGTAKVTIRGKGRYTGSVTRTFRINKRSITKNVKVTGVKNLKYNGKARRLPSLKVKVKIGRSWKTLKAGRDYRVKYSNNKKRSSGSRKAKVTIVGKGNYKGKISRSFRIVGGKSSPKLVLKKSSLKRQVNAGSFTVKLKTKKTNGKITWSSSNPNVASIGRSSGRVTIKGIGTTTITVRSAATQKYKAGKKTFKLKVNPLKLADLSYRFSNSSYGLGYYGNDGIPYSSYRMIFTAQQAEFLYSRYRGPWRGSCFGMSSSASLLGAKGNGVTVSSFGGSGNGDLGPYSYSGKLGMYLKTFIEAMQVSQFEKNMTRVESTYGDRIGRILAAVTNGKKTGKPPVICIYGKINGNDSGHAVLGLGVKHVSSSLIYLNIYDPNFPREARHITITRYGSTYHWGYHLNDTWWWDDGYRNGWSISCVPYSAVKKTWDNRGNNQADSGYYSTSMMHIDTDNFEICDADGKTVAVSEDGAFTSCDPDVYQKTPVDMPAEGTLVYLPSSEYQIINTGTPEEEMTVALVDKDTSVEVTTTAAAVTMDVSEEEARSLVTVDADRDESFSVTITSAPESGAPAEEITFTGEGTGQEVVLGTEEGACVINNGENVTLAVNGEEIARVAGDTSELTENGAN